MSKPSAKTPEEEVEPLADPEPDDAWPPVKEPHEPDEDEPPDKKASRGVVQPPEKPPSHVIRDRMREEYGERHFDMSGPHHS